MATTTQKTVLTDQKNKETPSAGPVRLGAVRRRRWRWISAGVLLIAAGAGANIALGLGQQEQVAVLAAARDLPAGHVLEQDDVRVVQLDEAARSLDLVNAREGGAFGKRLAVPITEDTPLTAGALGASAQYPPQGKAIVSAAVKPGVLPGAAEQGSPVAVITAPTASSGTGSTASGTAEEDVAAAGQGRSIPARVHTITRADPASGTSTVVELVVDAADAEAVARAAGQESLRLAVTAPSEGGR